MLKNLIQNRIFSFYKLRLKILSACRLFYSGLYVFMEWKLSSPLQITYRLASYISFHQFVTNVKAGSPRHAVTTFSPGVGVTKAISSVPSFTHFLALSKQILAIKYHAYIWQVSPQLSCGGTCQISMWFKWLKRYFCKIKKFVCGEINERSFRNPNQLW